MSTHTSPSDGDPPADTRAGSPEQAARSAPLDLDPEAFRALGYQAVDRATELLASLRSRPVTTGERPSDIRATLGNAGLPETGSEPAGLIDEAARLLWDHSLFNGHPRFLGYITSPSAPIGALAELLAATANPNCGSFILTPMATEIEAQTIRWIASMIGYPGTGGVLVSGGNMANMIGFLAGRRAVASWDIRAQGLDPDLPFVVYVSAETHTWIQKAADVFGLGTAAIRWIDVDSSRRMDIDALEAAIGADRARGALPLLVVGTAGTVSTGAIDPLDRIAAICRRERMHFHVDGAYGAPAAVLPEMADAFRGLALADTVALDPHKWLYAPVEAGCVLARTPELLIDAFSFRPAYYRFAAEHEGNEINYYEHGLQNSRGFRALKVWLALRQVGRAGYERMIRDDMALATRLHARAQDHPELEAGSVSLSIATFRYIPPGLTPHADDYLDELNAVIVDELQAGGEVFISNAIVDGRFWLRACVVNFRTTEADIDAACDIVVRVGRERHMEMSR